MAETAAQLETRLAEVRTAISKAIELQSYTKPGLSVNRGNLDTLMKLEKQLERKLARLNNGAFIISDFSQADADNVSGRF